MSKRRKSKRKIKTRDLVERILIVCEGEKTEPNYFRAFPKDENRCYVKPMGVGCVTKSLVKRAIEIRKISSPPFNKVWCVFDKDDCPDRDFNDAIQMAKSNNMDVAYSNEAFELWYLLHFSRYYSAMTRDQYQEKLGELLGHKYEKNSEKMYDELRNKQDTAIRNAERLLEHYIEIDGKIIPEKHNPSTTVHELVIELNKRLPITKK